MSALLRAGVLVATLALFLGVASGSGVILAQEANYAAGDSVVVNNGTLKLRAEASVSSDVLQILPEGTILSVTGDPTSADGLTWLEVSTSAGVAGWVSAEYVELAPAIPPAIGDTIAVVLGPLNLRETASEEASVVGKLNEGARAAVVDGPIAGNFTWYQVEAENGDIGWVAADYIKVTAPEGFEPGKEVVVGTGPVNMRVGPSVDSEIADTLDEGATLTILSGPLAGGGYTWYEVKTSGDKTGFVVATALNAVAGGESAATIDFPIGSFIFASEATDVREAGMVDATIVTTLAEGAIATVTEGPIVADDFTWFQVSVGEGDTAVTGWVQGESMTGGIVLGTNAVVADGPLNLRESASAEAESVALLEEGDVVNLVSGPQIVEAMAWFEVTAGDQTGFVAGQFLGPETTAAPTATPEA
ncbi:MAG: SH3 domain-containing protein [Thermomicrobiales bacterium]|nr:SH3 domain-containing protein [Thermomicrobiales bacterium]